MIYIVHGDNYPKTRALVLNQKTKVESDNKFDFNVEDATPERIKEAIYSKDLFGKSPFVVFDVTKAGRENMDKYIDVIEHTPEETTFVILAEKTLPKTNSFIKNAAKLKARISLNEKTIEGNVFKFSDNLFYKNREASYREFSKLDDNEKDPFRLMGSILYSLRNIAYIKFKSPLENKMAPFIRGKAKKQAESFSEESIKDLFKFFYDIDKKSKTGEIMEELIIPMVIEKVLNS